METLTYACYRGNLLIYGTSPGILRPILESISPGLRFIQSVQVLAQGGNDALILVGVLSEDILYEHGKKKYCTKLSVWVYHLTITS